MFLKVIQKSDKDLSTKLEAIFSLAKALNGIGKGLNEQTFKDAFKVIKGLFSDKHVMVRESSAKVRCKSLPLHLSFMLYC
jgi:hypothetical protein